MPFFKKKALAAAGTSRAAAAAGAAGADSVRHGGLPPAEQSEVTHGGPPVEEGDDELQNVGSGSGTHSVVAQGAVVAPGTAVAAASALFGAPPVKAAGPAFPTLGVTLEFLEDFVAAKVRGKRSRYGTTLVECPGDQGPDHLAFRKGEIVAVADIAQLDDASNGGWLTGYCRAGNWADRKKFRTEAVQWLAGLSTDEVCGSIIKLETAAESWPVEQKERSYARMVLAQAVRQAQRKTGIGLATVFASHAWTFVKSPALILLRVLIFCSVLSILAD